MKLLTKKIIKSLPALYWNETNHVSLADTVAHVKFFDPCGSWTWYACEFDGEDTFWGLVDGHEKEWGYFSLSEFMSVKGQFGLGIERDFYFKPTAMKNICPELSLPVN